MRKWFRIAILLVAVLSILCFAGCGKNSTEESTVSTVNKVEPPPEGPTMVFTEPTELIEETEPTQERGTRPVDQEETVESTTETIDIPEVYLPTGTAPADKPELVEKYEWYTALSGEEQMAFMNTFPDVPAFVAWYHEAKAAYDAFYPSIELGPDTTIDIGGNP